MSQEAAIEVTEEEKGKEFYFYLVPFKAVSIDSDVERTSAEQYEMGGPYSEEEGAPDNIRVVNLAGDGITADALRAGMRTYVRMVKAAESRGEDLPENTMEVVSNLETALDEEDRKSHERGKKS